LELFCPAVVDKLVAMPPDSDAWTRKSNLILARPMRRALVFILGLVLQGISVGDSYARSPSIAETDYLILVDGFFPSDYYALLRRKLFVTPADFVRIVDLSSGANEAVVAIYTAHGQGDNNVRITYTSPDKLLWEVGADSQNRFAKDPSVSVRRIDAPFPKALALSVSAALKHLLDERRPPMKTEQVIVDGRQVEFTVPSGNQSIRGLLDNYARGQKGRSLNHLTDLLESYCHANAAERRTLSAEIATEARKMARYPIRRKR
jgi:hypothetical protein